jgi:hypothetical protein
MNTATLDTTASTVIDLSGLPEPVIRSIRQLVADLQAVPPQTPPAAPVRQPLIGRFAHLGLSFSREEIDEARRELWANFPREFTDPEAK